MDKNNSIKNLIRSWPKGTLTMQRQLAKQGFSRQQIQQYLKSGWLSRFTRGVYQLADDTIEWTGVVYALQQYYGSTSVYLGGMTALEELGKAHYVPMGQNREIKLYHQFPNTRDLPGWLKILDCWPIHWALLPSSCFSNSNKTGFTQHRYEGFNLTLSSPERAMFELLDSVTSSEDLDTAVSVVEHLHSLRVDLVNQLLVECRSFKTKRLVVLLSKYLDLPWSNKLELSNVDLGSHKYQIGEGGYYYSEVKLGLPFSLEQEGDTSDELQ